MFLHLHSTEKYRSWRQTSAPMSFLEGKWQIFATVIPNPQRSNVVVFRNAILNSILLICLVVCIERRTLKSIFS